MSAVAGNRAGGGKRKGHDMKTETIKFFTKYSVFSQNHFFDHARCVVKPDLRRNSSDIAEDCIKTFQEALRVFSIGNDGKHGSTMRETDNKFMAVIQNSFLRKPYGSEITLRNARNCMIKRDHLFSIAKVHFLTFILNESVYCFIGTAEAFTFINKTVINPPCGMSLLGRH